MYIYNTLGFHPPHHPPHLFRLLSPEHSSSLLSTLHLFCVASASSSSPPPPRPPSPSPCIAHGRRRGTAWGARGAVRCGDAWPSHRCRAVDPGSARPDPVVGMSDPWLARLDLATESGSIGSNPWMGSAGLSTGFLFFLFDLPRWLGCPPR